MTLTLDSLKHKVRGPVLESKIWEPSNEEAVIIKSDIGNLDWVKKGVVLLKTFPLPSVLIYDDEDKYLKSVNDPYSDISYIRSFLNSGMHVIRISYHCTYQKEFLEVTVEVLDGEEKPIVCVSDSHVYEYLTRCL